MINPGHYIEKIKRYGERIAAQPNKKDLTRLGKIFRTDKATRHSYTRHYETHLSKFRKRKIKLIEIGVGGYNKPNKGGKSLRMWKHYFPKGRIYGIDIEDKRNLEEKRIKIFQGSQVDHEFMTNVLNETGDPDIIIDDGSHMNDHVITTFKMLFPRLKTGGIYIIEDTQTAYWPRYKGSSTDLNARETSMTYFQSLTHCLNHQEFLIPDYKPTYFDKHIESVHFYHNLVILHKGLNNEPSNIQPEDKY